MASVYNRSLRVREHLAFEVPYPVRGWSPLLPRSRTPEGASPLMDDCDIHNRILQKRWGTEKYGSTPGGNPLPGRIQRFVSFINVNGVERVVAVSTGGLASLDSGPSWVLRATGKSGVPEIVPFIATFQGKIVVANGVDKLYEWDGVAASAVELTQAPVARTVATLGGRVIAANVVGAPNLVKWSDYVNSANWTTGSAGEANLIDTNDAIQGLAYLRDQLAIVRRRSLWTVAVAEPPLFYRFERQFDGIGTAAPGSVASVPGGVAFLGPDDLYLFDGSLARPWTVADFSLRKVLEEETTVEGVRRAVAFSYPERGQYWLLLPLGGGTANTHVIVLDYVHRTVLKYRMALCGAGIAETPVGIAGVWSDFPNPWSAYQVSWTSLAPLLRVRVLGAFENAPGIPVVRTPVLSDYDHTIGGPVAIEQRWETGLLNFAGEQVRGDDLKIVHRVRVVGDPGSNSFKIRVGYSHDGDNVVWMAYQTIDTTSTEWVIDPSVPTEAQWWAAEIVQDAVGQGVRISSVIFYFSVVSPQTVDLRAWGGPPRG